MYTYFALVIHKTGSAAGGWSTVGELEYYGYTPLSSPPPPLALPVVSLQQKIVASDGGKDKYFGMSVAIVGDTIVVGAHDTDGKGGNSGSVYVYVRSGTLWSLQQKIVPGDGVGGLGAYFGAAVAFDGDTIVIGAFRHGTGAAYVYARSETAWSLQHKFAHPDDNPSFEAAFGWSVAFDRDTIVVGDYYDGSRSGSVYVYVRSGTSWSLQQKVVDDDGASNDQFGYSVAIDGDTIVVGANYDSSSSVFVRSGATWSLQQKLVASGNFGTSVDIDGDTIVVSAEWDSDKGFRSGSVYVYIRYWNSWSLQEKIVASDGSGGDHFGTSVALNGNTIVVGADGDDDKGYDSGSAYVYIRSGTSWSKRQKIVPSDGVKDARLGYKTAIDGDAIVLAAVEDDDKGKGSGSVYVYAR